MAKVFVSCTFILLTVFFYIYCTNSLDEFLASGAFMTFNIELAFLVFIKSYDSFLERERF